MKIIPPLEVDFSKTKRVCASVTSRQLFSLGTNEYLFVCKATNGILALESEELTEVMAELRSPIIDFELFAIEPLMCRAEDRHGQREFEVRLYLKSGDTYVLNSQDDLLIL